MKCDTQQQHQTELDPPRPAPPTNLHGQWPTRWVVDWLSHTYRAAAADAVKLMSSVSVSFSSARAAVNANETGYRRQCMQRPISPCNNISSFPQHLVHGQRKRAMCFLSKLVTGDIFHVQKIVRCWWGGCIPSSSPRIRHWLSSHLTRKERDDK